MSVRYAVRETAVQIVHGLDFWLGISKLARQTQVYVEIYGLSGLFLPYFLSYDVYMLVQSVLDRADNDALVQKFCNNQVRETSIVAMVGSVIAGNAVAALGKPLMSEVPWPAAAFMQASLVAALFCVYHSMRLNRIAAGLNTAEAIKTWLRSTPTRVRGKDKNRPSISTVLILDTPRTLVTMAIWSFVIAWSTYVFFVYIWGLDTVAGSTNSMNVMIFYATSLWLAITVYLKADIFDYYVDKEETWTAVRNMLRAIEDVIRNYPDTEDSDSQHSLPAASLPRHAMNRPMTQSMGPHPHASAMNEMARYGIHTPPELPERSGRSERSERSDRKSLGNALLAEALRESIDARRRAIESDEQFVRALLMYQPDMRSSYNS